MRLLIDTQIFIWTVLDSDSLSLKARQIMLGASEIFVSAASIWEIAIKVRASFIRAKSSVHFFCSLFCKEI